MYAQTVRNRQRQRHKKGAGGILRLEFHLVRRKVVADRPNGVDDPITMQGRHGQETVEDCIEELITMNRTFTSSNHGLKLSTKPRKTQSIIITFSNGNTFSAAVASSRTIPA